MNKVKMLQSAWGVNEGEIYPVLFAKDETVMIGDSLLRAFIDMGVVELLNDDADENKMTAPDETKPARQARARKAAK